MGDRDWEGWAWEGTGGADTLTGLSWGRAVYPWQISLRLCFGVLLAQSVRLLGTNDLLGSAGRMLVAKLGDLCLVSKTFMAEEQTPTSCSLDPHRRHGTHMPICLYTQVV